MNAPPLAPQEPSRRKRQAAAAALPIVFGLPELEAAAAVGVSQTKFREMVASGTMPQPRLVGGKLVYDVDELRAAFKAMPHRGDDRGVQGHERRGRHMGGPQAEIANPASEVSPRLH
jgi:hypothetical protein